MTKMSVIDGMVLGVEYFNLKPLSDLNLQHYLHSTTDTNFLM